MIAVASLSAVPQSCRTPLLKRENSKAESFHVQVLHLLRWFTHTQGDRQAETDTETGDRQRDREIERQKDRKTGRQDR